jgi:hypothetical protein
VDIELIDGRLPSKVLGLHLDAVGDELRLWDPKTQRYLLTPDEKYSQAKRQHEADRAEIERLQREVQTLKQHGKKGTGNS